jgi:hypothetical protein
MKRLESKNTWRRTRVRLTELILFPRLNASDKPRVARETCRGVPHQTVTGLYVLSSSLESHYFLLYLTSIFILWRKIQTLTRVDNSVRPIAISAVETPVVCILNSYTAPVKQLTSVGHVNPFRSYIGPRPTVWFSSSAQMSEDVRRGFCCVCSPAVEACPTLFLM